MSDEEQVAKQQDEECRQMLDELFDTLDVDGSGTLSMCELKTGMSAMGIDMTDDDINECLEACGKNGDEIQQLSREDFCDLVMEMRRNINMEKLRTDKDMAVRTIMSAFDKDGNGTISMDELSEFLKTNGSEKMSDEDCRQMFEDMCQADKNQDGLITEDELRAYLFESDQNAQGADE